MCILHLLLTTREYFTLIFASSASESGGDEPDVIPLVRKFCEVFISWLNVTLILMGQGDECLTGSLAFIQHLRNPLAVPSLVSAFRHGTRVAPVALFVCEGPSVFLLLFLPPPQPFRHLSLTPVQYVSAPRYKPLRTVVLASSRPLAVSLPRFPV